MTSKAYLNLEDRVCFVDVAEHARGSEVARLYRKMKQHQPAVGPGWRLILDERLSGPLVSRDSSGAGELLRAGKALGPDIRTAIVYNRNKPGMSADSLRSFVGLARNRSDRLRTFVTLSEALAWLDLPADFELRVGAILTTD